MKSRPATRPAIEAGVRGLIIRLFLPIALSAARKLEADSALPLGSRPVGPTVGDPAPAVNVQGCGISVGDCGFLWQALGVKTYRDHSQVPVVSKEARDILDSNAGNGSDQREPERSPPDSPVNERPVVLIVDDDVGVREALRFTLDEHLSELKAAMGRRGLSIVVD